MPEPIESKQSKQENGVGSELVANKLRLVMMGTGPFAVPSFEALRAAGHEICAVYTRPDRPGPGRKMPPPSPVRVWATEHRYEIFAPESINAPEPLEQLRRIQPDLLVVCDYGQILKANLLETASCGGINLHGSLLPAYRGAAPVQWAVLNADPKTGVSVIHMTPRLDAGPVIARRETEIRGKETSGELEERLSRLGVEATLEALQKITRARTAGGKLRPDLLLGTPQDPSKISKAPRLAKSDGAICWNQSAIKIDAWVRGMQPWPTAFTEIARENAPHSDPNNRLVILDVDILDDIVPEACEPGLIRVESGELWVASADHWIKVNRLKPAGRKEMKAIDWLRGRPLAGLETPSFR